MKYKSKPLLILKVFCSIVSLLQIGFFLFMLLAHDELPDISSFTLSEKLMSLSMLLMLVGTAFSIFLEFWGALLMLAGYAIKIFVDGIDYNFFFDSFLVLSMLNYLIYYLRYK